MRSNTLPKSPALMNRALTPDERQELLVRAQNDLECCPLFEEQTILREKGRKSCAEPIEITPAVFDLIVTDGNGHGELRNWIMGTVNHLSAKDDPDPYRHFVDLYDKYAKTPDEPKVDKRRLNYALILQASHVMTQVRQGTSQLNAWCADAGISEIQSRRLIVLKASIRTRHTETINRDFNPEKQRSLAHCLAETANVDLFSEALKGCIKSRWSEGIDIVARKTQQNGELFLSQLLDSCIQAKDHSGSPLFSKEDRLWMTNSRDIIENGDNLLPDHYDTFGQACKRAATLGTANMVVSEPKKLEPQFPMRHGSLERDIPAFMPGR